MDKKLTVSGKEIAVNFSVNYFFKYFFEATGIDLLSGKDINVEETDTTKIFDYLSGLVYAGSKAKNKLEKTEDYLSHEETADLVYSMTPVQAIDLLNECMRLLNGEEKNAQPQVRKKKAH